MQILVGNIWLRGRYFLVHELYPCMDTEIRSELCEITTNSCMVCDGAASSEFPSFIYLYMLIYMYISKIPQNLFSFGYEFQLF